MKLLIGALVMTFVALAQPADVQTLRFLSGTWSAATQKNVIEEYWSLPYGKTMMGWSRTVSKDTTVSYEFTMIRALPDGRFSFTAHPSGQNTAEFMSILAGDSIVVFENKGHDFPQRVIYRRIGRDSLLGRIEGTMHGRQRAVDFYYKRVPVH